VSGVVAAAIVVLVLVLPGLAVLQLQLIGDQELPRREVYISSLITIFALGAASLGIGWWQFGTAEMGLGAVTLSRTVLLAGALLALGVGLIVAFHRVRSALLVREARILRELLPQTAGDRRLFALLSLVAGAGEEIAYRGFLIAAMTTLPGGPWVAVGVSSTAFGLLHAYQGWLGILRTALLGALFGAAFVITRDLWAIMIAPAGVDLVVGLLLGDRLLTESDRLDPNSGLD
jgi:membrane protease YdiL (CAAX protease family)